MGKIIIFGTGSSLADFRAIAEEAEIVAYVDNDKSKQGTFIDGVEIIGPENIQHFEYDLIVITSKHCEEIKEQLISHGISIDNIANYNTEFSSIVNQSINEDVIKIQSAVESNRIEQYSICKMRSLGRKRRIEFNEDFVRYSSLELVAEEIYGKNIAGSVAELGVYRGDFAAKINTLFYNRKLYLFDTFKGFDTDDVEYEKEFEYSTSSEEDFSNTCVDIVIQKMKYPDNCIVKKGYFPDTTVGVEEKFVFVSIDTDLYKPTYAGLQWFYPQMEKGGYIFVHDYNNIRFQGAKQAVMDFTKENDISVFPLSDFAGSAVILK